MSYHAFGTLLLHAKSSHDELVKLQGALKLLRKRAKTREDARRINDQMHAVRYFMVKNSQTDLD